MKINLPFHYQLKINKQYTAVKTLLPIGCDCHPAYMLSKLELRKESFPFDWLDTKPLHALEFARDTIQSNFDYFLKDLKKDENGKVFAHKHPEALFYHFDDLIDNQNLQKKINYRIEQFLNNYRNKSCYFIHTIAANSFLKEEEYNLCKEAVLKFTSLLKENDELIIYVRFDEITEVNPNALQLQEFAKTLKNCKVIFYVREKEGFGIWGDESKYKNVLRELGIKTKFQSVKFKLTKVS